MSELRTRKTRTNNQVPTRSERVAGSPASAASKGDGTSWNRSPALGNFNPDHNSDSNQGLSSSYLEGEECGERTSHSSPQSCVECKDLLHQLANIITGVVINAQMLDWRLPPYSRLKRPIREMERNAQRSSELLKRLQQRLAKYPGAAQPKVADLGEPPFPAHSTAVTAQEPEQKKGEAELTPQPGEADSAPDFLRVPSELTRTCDACTSGFFPKRDDGIER